MMGINRRPGGRCNHQTLLSLLERRFSPKRGLALCSCLSCPSWLRFVSSWCQGGDVMRLVD